MVSLPKINLQLESNKYSTNLAKIMRKELKTSFSFPTRTEFPFMDQLNSKNYPILSVATSNSLKIVTKALVLMILSSILTFSKRKIKLASNILERKMVKSEIMFLQNPLNICISMKITIMV